MDYICNLINMGTDALFICHNSHIKSILIRKLRLELCDFFIAHCELAIVLKKVLAKYVNNPELDPDQYFILEIEQFNLSKQELDIIKKIHECDEYVHDVLSFVSKKYNIKQDCLFSGAYFDGVLKNKLVKLNIEDLSNLRLNINNATESLLKSISEINTRIICIEYNQNSPPVFASK